MLSTAQRHFINYDPETVRTHGKIVAGVSVHWIQLPSKTAASGVDVDVNKVTSTEFGGKTAATDFQ